MHENWLSGRYKTLGKSIPNLHSSPDATRFQGHATRFPGGAPRFHASTSAGPPSYPPPVAEPTIQDVYSLMYDMRGEQSAILYDIQSRVAAIEDEMRAWRFDPSDDWSGMFFLFP